MSIEYDLYLQQHKDNVRKGYEWIKLHIPEILKGLDLDELDAQIGLGHDASKTSIDEYGAYDRYFYGGNKSHQVLQDFNYAWLMHIHRNPHHWQYWVLINDNPSEGMVILDMPLNYIIEMISDWWAFSWNSGDLYEIFKWYDEHKDYMKLSDNTRKTVDDILAKIQEELDKEKSDEKRL